MARVQDLENMYNDSSKSPKSEKSLNLMNNVLNFDYNIKELQPAQKPEDPNWLDIENDQDYIKLKEEI